MSELTFSRFVGRIRDEGASAVEYGLIVVAVAAVITLTVFALGTFNRQSFDSSCDKIADKMAQSDCSS